MIPNIPAEARMGDTRFLQRRFLLKAVAGTAGLAVTAGASPFSARGAILTAPEEFATIIDVDRCTGCGACVDACRKRNLDGIPLPKKPIPRPHPAGLRINDWSDRRDETSRLTPYNWLFIQSCVISANGKERRVYLPRRCLHCLNPQCVTLCPTGALRQSQEGATYIDRDFCIGDGPCDRACPWNIPQRQSGVGPYLRVAPEYVGSGMAFKCDYCTELLQQGKKPACVDACPQAAMTVGPREQMVRQAKEMAQNRGGDLFGMKENGGTNTIYVSSVPFRDIEANMLRQGQVGYGMPSLRPAGASLDKENSVLRAVLLAPAAGAVLAGVRIWRDRQKDKK